MEYLSFVLLFLMGVMVLCCFLVVLDSGKKAAEKARQEAEERKAAQEEAIRAGAEKMRKLYDLAKAKCPPATETSPPTFAVDIGMGMAFEFTKFKDPDGTYRYDMKSPSYDDVGIIVGSSDEPERRKTRKQDNDPFSPSNPLMWL